MVLTWKVRSFNSHESLSQDNASLAWVEVTQEIIHRCYLKKIWTFIAKNVLEKEVEGIKYTLHWCENQI